MQSFNRYANYYDLLYHDKDYNKECNFIEAVFKKYTQKPIVTILDVGCGTGGHALSLAERGYHVTGIDLSPTMIDLAKAKQSSSRLDFHTMDIRNLDLGKKFDACIGMFAVMDYITEDNSIHTALTNIRRHLNHSSLFIFDFWNGLAVLRILPATRVRVIENNGIKLVRIAQPELDAFNHICRVKYHLIVTQDNKLIDEIEETHDIRFYFPQEIIHYLADANFKVLEICPFPELGGNVNENVWNIAAIARAV